LKNIPSLETVPTVVTPSETIQTIPLKCGMLELEKGGNKIELEELV
jgi:hypothetical protein